MICLMYRRVPFSNGVLYFVSTKDRSINSTLDVSAFFGLKKKKSPKNDTGMSSFSLFLSSFLMIFFSKVDPTYAYISSIDIR